MSYFLEKKVSRLHGLGIFASKLIKKGEEFYFIPMENVVNKNFFRYAYVGNGRYVNDEKILNWVNHCCNPNTKIDINRPNPALVALRDIEVGEEITCDYNKTEVNGVKFNCNCGEEKCREKVGKIRNG